MTLPLNTFQRKGTLPFSRNDTLIGGADPQTKIEDNSRNELLLVENDDQAESQISLDDPAKKQSLVDLDSPEKP